MSWGVRPEVTPGRDCVCVQKWTEGWCHDPQVQGPGDGLLGLRQASALGCAEHPQGQGKTRGKVLRGSRGPLLGMWSRRTWTSVLSPLRWTFGPMEAPG